MCARLCTLLTRATDTRSTNANPQIGRIEVRADDSLDIRQYVHKKSFDLCVLPLGTQLSALRDKWASLMKQYIQPLYAARLLWSQDAVMLSPFAVQQAYQKINGLPGGRKDNGKFFPMIKTLAMMARAMEYLVVQSVTSFLSVLKDIEGAGSKNLVNSSGFREVLRDTTALRSRVGYVGHPKMEKLRSMCIEHFTNAQDERDEYTGERRETRVMIFCNFRSVVEEIVDCLNTQRPLIKATPFVGQASSKGTKGKSQKEQLEVRCTRLALLNRGPVAPVLTIVPRCLPLRRRSASSSAATTTSSSPPRSARRGSTLARSTSSSATRPTSRRSACSSA